MIIEDNVGYNLFVFEVRLETKHEIHLSFLKQFQQFLYRPADDVKSNSRVLPGEVLDGFHQYRCEGVGYSDVKYSRQHLLEVVDLCKTEFSVL